jgi:hypothetical protein
MSSFEYLLVLNRFSGRTFSDIHQYPIFPWVLADYASPDLDLSVSSNFRNFAWPVDPPQEHVAFAYTSAPVTKRSVERMLAHTPFGEVSSEGFTSIEEMHAAAR